MEQSPFGYITAPQLVKKFPTFYGTQRLITVFTYPATCPYSGPDESNTCHPIPFPDDPL
jgi:hypothetical protein